MQPARASTARLGRSCLAAAAASGGSVVATVATTGPAAAVAKLSCLACQPVPNLVGPSARLVNAHQAQLRHSTLHMHQDPSILT